MSLASSSIPCIKLKLSHPSSFHKSTMNTQFVVNCMSNNADGPLRRPSLSSPPSLSPPSKPVSPNPTPNQTQVTTPTQTQTTSLKTKVSGSGVTLEFQRKRAKEMQDYFKMKKLEEVDQGPFFGFIAKNEISNGRWAMFGFAVGLLTEYATGADFVQQLKILLSNFGILDLD